MRNALGAVILVGFFLFLLMTAVNLRPFGEPVERAMDDYFINNAQNETASNNVVTSIVFDYRGFDTLGEATILFTAVAGVYVLLRDAMKKGGDEE
jgi:multisubunit Na+/H+ antiporter MnhB subunit